MTVRPPDRRPGPPPVSLAPFFLTPLGAPPVPPPQPTRSSARSPDDLVVALLVGTGIGLTMFALRAPLDRSAGIGLTVAVAVFAMLALFNLRGALPDPLPPPPAPQRWSAPRWELPRFDRMLHRPADYGDAIRQRLRAIADGRLTQLGLDFESAEARRLLGPGPYRLLTAAPDRPPSVAELRELVEALARLCDPGRRSASAPPPKGPSPR